MNNVLNIEFYGRLNSFMCVFIDIKYNSLNFTNIMNEKKNNRQPNPIHI